MEQKVVKIGSSIGIVIPKSLAKERGFRLGEAVDVGPEVDSNDIRIRLLQKTEGTDQINPTIMQWTEDFIVKNRELLDRLKDK